MVVRRPSGGVDTAMTLFRGGPLAAGSQLSKLLRLEGCPGASVGAAWQLKPTS